MCSRIFHYNASWLTTGRENNIKLVIFEVIKEIFIVIFFSFFGVIFCVFITNIKSFINVIYFLYLLLLYLLNHVLLFYLQYLHQIAVRILFDSMRSRMQWARQQIRSNIPVSLAELHEIYITREQN